MLFEIWLFLFYSSLVMGYICLLSLPVIGCYYHKIVVDSKNGLYFLLLKISPVVYPWFWSVLLTCFSLYHLSAVYVLVESIIECISSDMRYNVFDVLEEVWNVKYILVILLYYLLSVIEHIVSI